MIANLIPISSDWRDYKVLALIALCKRIFTGKFGKKKMNTKDNNSLTRGTHLWTAWELVGDSISVMARVRFRLYEIDLLSIWCEMWKAFPAKKSKSFFFAERLSSVPPIFFTGCCRIRIKKKLLTLISILFITVINNQEKLLFNELFK